MNIFIIEDNPFFRQKLLTSIQQNVENSSFSCQLLEEVVTAKQLMHQDLTNGPHIYFLDIELQEQLNGIDLGREIRKVDINGYIIYITSLEDKLLTVIDEHIAPLSFISKNIDESIMNENVSKALNKVREREQLRADDDYFLLQRTGRQLQLPYREILYFEKVPRSKKVVLHTVTGMYTINHYLGNIKTELNESQFIFLNSFIIHLNAIQSLDSKEDLITFKNGTELLVGKHTFRKIKNQFSTYNTLK